MSLGLADLHPQQVPGLSLAQVLELSEGKIYPETADVTQRIAGVTVASNEVAADYLFVALAGARAHGWDYAPQAVEAGATAILTTSAGLEALKAKALPVPVIACENPREVAGLVAAQVFGDPSSKLKVYGVTGTNGKSTSTRMLRAAFEDQPDGHRAGNIGTVGIDLGGVQLPSARTSLEAPLLQQLLAFALENGTQEAAIEVSSHALELGRISGLKLETVGFLNLQRDHLDFHGTMEDYFLAKAKLFDPARAQRGVICVDDQWGERLAAETKLPHVTVATEGKTADWNVRVLPNPAGMAGTDFELYAPAGSQYPEVVRAHCPLPGHYNVQNMAVALVMAAVSGHDVQVAAERIARNTQVPGRMEIVQGRTEEKALTVVDYAHTTDAIVLSCQALRPHTPGRIILVFGATGERDRGKRAQMGQSACECADLVIVTDDDPYTEPTDQIRAEVLQGCPSFATVSSTSEAQEALSQAPNQDQLPALEVDGRELAIQISLGLARPEDTVLLAGRGHETIQVVGTTPVELDDRLVAREFWAQSGRK
ncbi:hypothetical protein BSR29_03745 [Boudabousia liubingyangii]|uniref:UDP-N-acetylmuramyl-tripeptide synthetase n=1 Tax=Boudabousia liubingyangii TaxID=1921764 RepID=A0A1Q5PN64_9ACTO|nr:UDP-N-acetylmuramoyl-L-alanyl-D-glutamate--2,6-diaminopimelate ligase [Boudabousia liubingyangii]OKL47539.1 hypothetical protein BSR28_03315 [Boudabousia liubingyangii]OKL48963.1 hypothetical protein BSR29_03745 [Boudabousia liubingyangii]